MNEMNKYWADHTWDKVVNKMEYVAQKDVVRFPYTLDEEGNFTEVEDTHHKASWWTNGFYAGIMWLLYQDTNNNTYKRNTEKNEESLDEALLNYDYLDHDVGFLWLHTSVANYRITGEEKSRKRGMLAAATLASRYNIKGEFIRTWNGLGDSTNRSWQLLIV